MRKRGNSQHKRLLRKKLPLRRSLMRRLWLTLKPSNLRLHKIRRRLKIKQLKQSLIKRQHKLLSLSQMHSNSHLLSRYLLKMLKNSLYLLVKCPQLLSLISNRIQLNKSHHKLQVNSNHLRLSILQLHNSNPLLLNPSPYSNPLQVHQTNLYRERHNL
jgi:hypothetical protein